MRVAMCLLLACGASACGGFHTPDADADLLPGPALIGRIDAGLREPDADPLRLSVAVNGDARRVFLATDGSFAVKELPLGSAHIELIVDERATAVELTDLQPGEVVEVELKYSPVSMHTESLVRDRSKLAYHFPVRSRGGVQVLESSAVYFFDPGEYAGGLEIRGQNVKLFAANADEECETRERAAFRGDILILGNEIGLYDISTFGTVRMGGKNIRIHSACDDLWVSDVAPALIDEGINVGNTGGIGVF